MDDLLLTLGVDLGDLEREFARGPRLGREFAQSVAAGMGSIQLDTPQVDITAFRTEGAKAGAALSAGLASEVRSNNAAVSALRTNLAELSRLASEVRLTGDSGDSEALRQLVGEELRMAQASAGARTEVAALSNALQALNEDGLSGRSALQFVEQTLTNLERTAQRVASLPTIAPTVTAAAPGVDSQAAVRAAEEERVARAQVTAELANEIRTLGLYGRTIDSVNVAAVSAWRTEAAAIRAQGTELGVSRQQMLRLDSTIQQVERRFASMEGAASRSIKLPDVNAGGFSALVKSSGEFSALGNRVGQSAVAVAFALESVASASGNADSGLKTALRAVASLGVAFGPEGLLVSGIAAGTAALLDMAHGTSAAEESVKHYTDRLREQDRVALDATTSVRNLTAAQAAQRQLALSDNLREARDISTKMRAEIGSGLDEGFLNAIKGAFSFKGAGAESFRAQLRDVRADFIANRIEVDSLGLAVANIGNRFPELTKDARQFTESFVRPLQDAEKLIRDSNAALGGIRTATHLPGGSYDSGLREQIADARDLAQAERAGGLAAREATSIAQRAFAQWKTSQVDVTRSQLSFRDALKSTDPEVRGMAEAIQRDARTLAQFSTAGRTAKTELRDLDRELAAFRERARTPAITFTPGGEVAAMRSYFSQQKLTLPPLTLDTERVKLSLRDVDVAVAEVRRSALDLDLSKAFGSPEAISGAEFALRNTSAAAKETARIVLPLLQAIQDPQQRAAALDRFREQLRDIGDVVPKVDRLGVSLDAIGASLHGVVSIADAFGRVDESVRKSLDGVSGLLTGLGEARRVMASMRAAAKEGETVDIGSLTTSLAGIGSIVGIAGGLASLASVIFAGSAIEREHTETLRRNNDEISGLRADLSGFVRSAAGLSAVSRAVASDDLVQIVKRGFGNFGTEIDPAALRGFGLTLDDLNAVAKQYSITLTDSNGRIIPGSLRQLGDAIEVVVAKLFTWGNGLDALTDQRSLYNSVHDFDLTDSAGAASLRAIRDSASIFERIAPDLYARIFDGVDVSAASGRELLNKRFNEIMEEELSAEFKSGKGWLAELMRQSGFESLTDFNKWLLGADNALDGFTKSALTATDALGNLPVAFKSMIDQARFNATAPGLPSTLPAIPAPRPLTPPTGATDGSTGGVSVVYNLGPVTIESGKQDSREVYDDLEQELISRARAAGGISHPAMLGFVHGIGLVRP